MKLRSIFDVIVWSILGSLFFLLLLIPIQILYISSLTVVFKYVAIFLAVAMIAFSVFNFRDILYIGDEVLKIVLGSDAVIALAITVFPSDVQVHLPVIAKILFVIGIILGLLGILFKTEYKKLRIRNAFAALCISYTVFALVMLIQSWIAPLLQ